MEAFPNGVLGLTVFQNLAINVNAACAFAMSRLHAMVAKIATKTKQSKYSIVKFMVDGPIGRLGRHVKGVKLQIVSKSHLHLHLKHSWSQPYEHAHELALILSPNSTVVYAWV